MIKDELGAIEAYVQELEALRNYPQVKAERDSLAVEVTKLKEKVGKLTTQITSETSRHKETLSELRKRKSEVEDLHAKLGRAERELASLKEFKAKLPAGGELSLERMKERFLRAEAKEIEAKAQARSEELEKERQSRMPVQVREELTRILSSPNWPPEIEKVITGQARKLADEVLRDTKKWPDWFTDHFIQRVNAAAANGLDSEFNNRVLAETQSRLEVMKTGEWERYTAAKARELAVNVKALVGQLGGSRSFTCDRCGRRLAVEIGPSEIAQLLADKTVAITCSFCFDFVPFPLPVNLPHKVSSLTLPGLLQSYLWGTPPG